MPEIHTGAIGLTSTQGDPAHRRLPPLLRRTWYHMTQAFRRRIAHLRLTPHQFTVLRWLHEETSGSMTQRRLVDLMASDPNTVTSTLNRMEASVLIERKPHASDRRAKVVRLRPRGKKVYAEARRVALELQNQVLGVLPKPRRAQFLEHLEMIANSARDASEQVGLE